jgi:hypothetical protein
MRAISRTSRLPWLFGSIICLMMALPAQMWAASDSGGGKGEAAPLIQQMVGSWTVQEWMWPGPNTKPVPLPAATAQRRLVGDDILQETMTAAPGASQSFTRIAYFDYNAVNRQYEYFSIDTRAPQMMNERSFGPGNAAHSRAGLSLYGGIFVAPQWGPAKNAAFRYRLVLGDVASNQQSVELYLTPLSGETQKEFLAFKYIYTREH